jgi:hypothetical protein
VIVSDASGGKTYASVPQPPGALSGTGLTGPAGGSVTGVTFCYTKRVVVTKTATTTYKRTYDWTIEKTANPTTLNLQTGQSADSTFTVKLTRGAGTDSDVAVSGKITVSNPWTRDAVLTGITDTMTGGLTGAVSALSRSRTHWRAARRSSAPTARRCPTGPLGRTPLRQRVEREPQLTASRP